MKKTILLVLLVSVFSTASASAQNKQIEEIRQIYKQTNEKIRAAEKLFVTARKDGGIAETEIFLTEVQFNKGNTSYPAVGIFREEIKFYFTFGKGENPDRLLQIETVTFRAAAVERREYIFDKAGQFIFYFEDPDMGNMDRDEETRIYFSGGKMIRFQVGDDIKTDSPIFRRKNEIVQEVLEKQKKLVNVFRNSL
jgi:hypothetical protein